MEFTALPRRSKDRFAPAFFNARLSQRIVSSCSSSVARYAFSITLRIFMSPSVDTLAYHLVGITNVLVDSSAIFRKSAGDPRFTPSIAFPAPRSSTQRPQFTQVNRGLVIPISSKEATKARVVG